jgi:phosphatidylglycerol---prolipoprotein diacylglyceryl transferase
VVSLVGIVLGAAGLLWLYVGRRPLPDVVPSTPEQWPGH